MNSFKIKLKILLVVVVTIPLLTGCPLHEGTTGGNPIQVATGFVVTGSSQAATVAATWFERAFDFIFPRAVALPPPIMRDASGRIVLLNKAWISFVDVEFKADEAVGSGETPGADVTFVGPFHVNLLDPNPNSLDVANLNFSFYRRVQASLYKQGPIPADAPPEMLGHSIYLEGRINGMLFSFRSEESNAFVVAGPNQILPSPSSDLLLSFYFANLFRKIDLSSITAPTIIAGYNKIPAIDPCPAIKPGASDLYECFSVGLQTETNLGNDENGNAELDGHEPSVD